MILVAGATGSLGGRIVRTLLEQEHAVRVLVRDPSPSEDLAPQGLATSADSLIAAGAQPWVGDLTDRATLDAACSGVHTVITTASATKRGGDIEAVDLNGTLNLVDAARQAAVDHFVYTSASGSALGHPNPLFHAKAACEEALEDSGMTWTALQPSIFPEVWVSMVVGIPLQAGLPVTLVGEADHKHSFISEADVAAFAVATVGNPLAHNRKIEIGGPSYSWSEIVTMVGEAMGQPLPVNYVPLGSNVPLLDPMIGGLLNAFETYEDAIDMGDTPVKFDVTLTPLKVVIRKMFGQP